MNSEQHGRGRVPGLAASRLWAATRFPYLATGVFGATVIAEPGSGTVSVDESWRMHADPDLVAGWTPSQLGSVLVHHVCHLLRTHGERARAASVGPDDASAWLRAADAEINDDLVPAGLDLPGQPILPRHLGREDGLLAEQYYAPGKRTGAQLAGWLNCGGGAHGQPGDCECPGGLPGWQAELLRRQVAHEVIAHAKQAGNVPAGMLRWAEETLSPRVDWRRQLAAELRRAISEVSGAVDYSYRRPSRRSSVSGAVILPALRRPVPEVAVVCDTSGSMSDDLLAMVLAEVEGLLRALGRTRQLRVLACDTAVGAAQRVSSARQVSLVGGGGTNMGAGIRAAGELRPRPAVCVVLTDGYTPWPAGPPKGMRVVVGLLGDSAPEAPSWAREVRVPATNGARLPLRSDARPPWHATSSRRPARPDPCRPGRAAVQRTRCNKRSLSAAAAGCAAAFADVAAARRAHLGAAGEAERGVGRAALLELDELGRGVRACRGGRGACGRCLGRRLARGRRRCRGRGGGRGG